MRKFNVVFVEIVAFVAVCCGCCGRNKSATSNIRLKLHVVFFKFNNSLYMFSPITPFNQ